MSGNFGPSTDDDLHSNTGMSEHGDQGIDAESIDLPSDEITHARLSHAEQICRFGLCEPTSLDQLAELDHQVGAHLEILSFLARKTEVAKDVAAGASNPRSSHPASHLLNAPELVAHLAFRILRKSSDVIERGAKPAERLLRQDGIYTFLYIAASCRPTVDTSTKK